MKGKKVVKIISIVILSIVGLFIFVLMPLGTAGVYSETFGKRYETPEWVKVSVEDFPGLKMTPCNFKSSKGQNLAGYKFYKDNLEKDVNGLVIIAHGFGGGGFNTYMDVADYFTSYNYYVFGHDCTGNDNSEGDAVYGMPQGVIDLDYAINYAKTCPEYKNLPIMLFGHSWGGYSVTNVLNVQPDVNAVVTVAGFNRSINLMTSQGKQFVGAFIYPALPYISLYELFKFGKYSTFSGKKGFKKSDAAVMVLHSRDDKMISPEYGIDVWKKSFGEDSRFKFVEFQDRGHSYIFYDDSAIKYQKQVLKDYKEYVKENNYELNSVPKDITDNYFSEHLDKNKWCKLDEDVMGSILKFYNDSFK